MHQFIRNSTESMTQVLERPACLLPPVPLPHMSAALFPAPRKQQKNLSFVHVGPEVCVLLRSK